MNPLTSKTTFLMSALMAASLAGAQTFTLAGWSKAVINGTTFLASSGATLPPEVEYDVAGQLQARFGAACAAYYTGKGPNVPKYSLGARIEVKYFVQASVPSSAVAMYVHGSLITATETNATSHAGGSSAKASSSVIHCQTASSSSTNGTPPNDPDGPYTSPTKLTLTLIRNSSWVPAGGGLSNATFYWKSPSLTIKTVATSTLVSGKWYNSKGAGQAVATYVPIGTSWVVKSASGSGLPPKRVGIKVTNTSNTVLDDFDLEADSGVVPLSLDSYAAGTYNIYLSAERALRKKVIISYNGSTSITGLDFSLKFGDLDGDNYVSSSEVNYVSSIIGASVTDGDSWYGDPLTGFAPYMADFDEDGTITSADYSAAYASLGLYGD